MGSDKNSFLIEIKITVIMIIIMKGKITEISKSQAREMMLLKIISHHQSTKAWPVPEHPWQPPPFLLSTALHGVGYPAQLGSSVLAVPSASVWRSPSCLGAEVVLGGGKALNLCNHSSAASSTSLCYPHCFHTNPKHSSLPAAVRAINSVTAKTSAGSKVFLNILHYSKGSLPALQNAVLGFVYGMCNFSILLDQFLGSLMMAEVRTLMFSSSVFLPAVLLQTPALKVYLFQFVHQILKEDAYNCGTTRHKMI